MTHDVGQSPNAGTAHGDNAGQAARADQRATESALATSPSSSGTISSGASGQSTTPTGAMRNGRRGRRAAEMRAVKIPRETARIPPDAQECAGGRYCDRHRRPARGTDAHSDSGATMTAAAR
jgi:hypothetical protein